MRTIVTVTASVLAVWSGLAAAHGPSRQKVEETIEIAAPPATVWDVVKDFGSLHTWCPRVTGTTAQGGNEKGATRELKLPNGRVIKEELKSYDADKMSFQYKITEVQEPADFPVANYSSTFEVTAGASGGSKVDWSGAFYRSFMTNNPPPEQNDAAALAAVTGIYKDCLANLKTVAEAKK
jgi:uncharacterized protein YndB with AHSA1/START domain